MKHCLSILALAATLSLSACAEQPTGGDLIVDDAWARATAPGQAAAAAYLTLDNASPTDDRLVGVSTPVGTASLHRTMVEDGIASMKPIDDGLTIAADETAMLEPQGDHIMIMGLKAPLVAGERFELTLDFEKGEDRTVSVSVVEPGAR